MTVMSLSLHCLSGEGDRGWRWGGLLLRDLYHFCGSDRRMTLSRRRRGGAVGSCGEGSCGRGGTRGRGGGSGRGLDRGGVLNWGRESSGGCLGSSRLVVVHLEDVLLEVSDPVLLHRQWTVKLHLAEPDAGTKNTSKLGIMQDNTTRNLYQSFNTKQYLGNRANVVLICIANCCHENCEHQLLVYWKFPDKDGRKLGMKL